MTHNKCMAGMYAGNNLQSAPGCGLAIGGSIWERIVKHKLPVVEPRDSADFPTAAQDFRDKLNDPSASGAVFLAVCRCFAPV